jgi:hypothetical protein
MNIDGFFGQFALYHVTTPEKAAAIQRDGFVDCGPEWVGGRWGHGVWLSNEPLWELEPDPVAFEIDLSLESVTAYEYTLDHGYRRWLVPSSVVNQADRRLLARRQFKEEKKI